MPEPLLRYWREDPLLNEHHEHWHLVYPYPGLIDRKLHTVQERLDIAAGKIPPRYLTWHDRHGELFAYMHAQLLARYRAECLSAGLPFPSPFCDYRSPIPEGYEPGIEVMRDGKVWRAGNRPDATILSDVRNPQFISRPGSRVELQEGFRDRIFHSIISTSGGNYPDNISELGERIEATSRMESPYFGALHNDGHVLISLHNDNPQSPGCMFWEATAVRDPVFFRWHAHIDELFCEYRKTLEPHVFWDLPPVTITAFSVIGTSGQNLLTTEMRTRDLRRKGGGVGPTISFQPIAGETVVGYTEAADSMIDYLSHEDFTYSIEAMNETDKSVAVTVRIFAAPEELVDDRASWIEMDKFRHVLGPNQNSFTRSSRSSSVIRHPVWTAAMLEGAATPPNESGISLGCRCGWPYTLLLPRGKTGGMSFRFLVLCSSAEDLVSDYPDGNSSSYCGLEDSKYPDKQPMGYPFDRTFAMPIRDWIDRRDHLPQLASVGVQIRHADHTGPAILLEF